MKRHILLNQVNLAMRQDFFSLEELDLAGKIDLEKNIRYLVLN